MIFFVFSIRFHDVFDEKINVVSFRGTGRSRVEYSWMHAKSAFGLLRIGSCKEI